MPISPLPEATVHQLGAALAITSPVVLVKELLDNALDSGASSIAITVSPNTVDKIEIRDNGHGISHGDFNALARCGYTSKLRTFHDLDGIGGNSLGFRGVALASAATLAEIRVITRIPEEPFAATLLLLEKGGATLEERKAAPIGTTVVATRLFHKSPVRLRSAKSEATRTIQTIKRLLQSYVLARPRVKMTFRVLGATDTAWQYTPGLNTNPREAVLRVFGPELTSMCSLYQLSGSEPSTCVDAMSDSSPENAIATSLEFEAVLPRPEVDIQKIGKGAFLSVDSRPISAARGTGKRLVSLFRSALTRRRGQLGLGDAPRDTFIRLDIRCPPGSYDVNVEPAKDDVLFSREDHLVKQFEKFMASVYATSPREDDDQEEAHVQEAARQSPQVQPEIQGPAWRVDMSQGLDLASDDDDDGIGPSNSRFTPNQAIERPPPESSANADRGPSSTGLNPWSIAMMAAPRRSNEAHEAQKHLGRTPLPSSRLKDRTDELSASNRGSVPVHPEFMWDYPESIPEDATRPEAVPLVLRRSAPVVNRSITAGRSRVPGGPYRRPAQATISSSFNKEQRRPPARTHEFLHPIPSSLRSTPRNISYGARTLPNFREEGRNGLRQLHGDKTRMGGNQIRHVHPRSTNSDESATNRRGAIERYLQSVEQMPDVKAILRPSRAIRPQSPPSESRKKRDNEVIEVPPEETSRSSLSVEDTRAYLIRRQRSIVAQPEKKLRRMRTDLLPFEKIPQSFQTQDLALKLNISPEKVSKQLFFGATQPDPYHSGDGSQKPNLLDDDMELQLVEHQTAAFLAGLGAEGVTVALKPVLSASEA